MAHLVIVSAGRRIHHDCAKGIALVSCQWRFRLPITKKIGPVALCRRYPLLSDQHHRRDALPNNEPAFASSPTRRAMIRLAICRKHVNGPFLFGSFDPADDG